jgi:hypothetical protein
MRRPKYPLEPLAKLREQKVDEATRALAGAVANREKAERARAGAELRRASHEADARGLRQAERGALERGELKAADLARAGAWEMRVAEDREKLEAVVKSTREEEKKARQGEAEARADATARRADAEVVEKDRTRWREGERKHAEAKEEEAATEAFRRRG